jgi:hypothetical protein
MLTGYTVIVGFFDFKEEACDIMQVIEKKVAWHLLTFPETEFEN